MSRNTTMNRGRNVESGSNVLPRLTETFEMLKLMLVCILYLCTQTLSLSTPDSLMLFTCYLLYVLSVNPISAKPLSCVYIKRAKVYFLNFHHNGRKVISLKFQNILLKCSVNFIYIVVLLLFSQEPTLMEI